MEEVYCMVWEKCKYTGGVPLFVGGNEGRIYERGLFSFRECLKQFMVTWKLHLFYLSLIFVLGSTCAESVYRALNSMS